jgi:hypothetical protein
MAAAAAAAAVIDLIITDLDIGTPRAPEGARDANVHFNGRFHTSCDFPPEKSFYLERGQYAQINIEQPKTKIVET